jgi:CubicO group peptidase (beta-lactamase class C family)
MRSTPSAVRLTHGLCLVLLTMGAAGAETWDASAKLEEIRGTRKVPALAAAAIQKGEILAIGAVGVRRLGGEERVTVNDRWHLGSCTKSMTASLAALLVERKKIRFESTIGEVIGARVAGMNSTWRDVTLEQLFQHRAGAPGKAPPELWGKAWAMKGSPSEQRWAFVSGLLAEPPASEPGQTFKYSNQGYSIAGQMLETVSATGWEDLLKTELFTPLGLKSAGYGAPATLGQVDQPWGHSAGLPVAPGPGADNPPAIGPGGTVHMRYAGWHASRNALLSRASFERLHTPPTGAEYAMGFYVTERGWAGGKALMHTGSNTMNFAVMWIAPAKEFAVVAATNSATREAEQACDDACAALIRKLLPPQ